MTATTAIIIIFTLLGLFAFAYCMALILTLKDIMRESDE